MSDNLLERVGGRPLAFQTIKLAAKSWVGSLPAKCWNTEPQTGHLLRFGRQLLAAKPDLSGLRWWNRPQTVTLINSKYFFLQYSLERQAYIYYTLLFRQSSFLVELIVEVRGLLGHLVFTTFTTSKNLWCMLHLYAALRCTCRHININTHREYDLFIKVALLYVVY